MSYTSATAQITAAVSGTVLATYSGLGNPNGVSAVAKFTYGSGGTNVTIYGQTSYDGGTTWWDVMAFRFTTSSAVKSLNARSDVAVLAAATPTVGALTVDTAVNGLLGEDFRFFLVSTGTYAGNTEVSVTPNFTS
jgi:hypothetical protein